ncbi:hypothetical protein ACRRTK_013990 [Alexandromys fortis]
MSTEGAPFPLVLTGRLKLGLAQLLNSSLEAALTEDEVSLFRGVGDYVVWKNFKEKKCNDKFMNGHQVLQWESPSLSTAFCELYGPVISYTLTKIFLQNHCLRYLRLQRYPEFKTAERGRHTFMSDASSRVTPQLKYMKCEVYETTRAAATQPPQASTGGQHVSPFTHSSAVTAFLEVLQIYTSLITSNHDRAAKASVALPQNGRNSILGLWMVEKSLPNSQSQMAVKGLGLDMSVEL